MLVTALLASLAACHPAVRTLPPLPSIVTAAADSSLRPLFESGTTFADFVAAATARREGWLRLQREAAIDPALLTRARAVPGQWQLLVVAVDACGDSMNSVPYAARLADSVPSLTLRIVAPAAGRAVQEGHRSPDGRAATPTFVLLDARGADVGCLVELPAPLRQWTDSARKVVTSDSVYAYRRAFYDRDRGASLVTELVEVLEAAASGRPRCDRQGAR
jgi:hypothetical protein